MKRFHLHIAVDNLPDNIRFYSALFATEPTRIESDFAEWLLEDPCLSFAISRRGQTPGVQQLGMLTESDAELEALNQRLLSAALPSQPQKNAAGYYARSDKYWTLDPQGIAWELFHPLESIAEFGEDAVFPAALPEQERIFNVLFLCTGNSARSIMAEALLNKLGAGRFHAYSAGSHPAGKVNPTALERLAIENIPAPDARSKSWDEFTRPDAPRLDLVITVCDKAAGEVCPAWPGQPITAHWGVDDPAAIEGDEKHLAFARAFAILERRIKLLTHLKPEGLERLVLEQQVRNIGRVEETPN